MKQLSKRLAFSASIFAFSISHAAYGQTSQEAGDDNDSEVAMMDRVVVTSRKVEESLLEVPVAVSVLDARFFAETGFNTIEDIVRFVPGFDLTPVNTSRATGSKIRGISTFSFSDGFESSVATVIDGVVLGREAQGFTDLFDIESVEIIKGPQGTLFGKNASAGVVNIRTQAPEFEFGGGADITYGTFDEVKVRGTVTGPIIDDLLAFRLSGTFNRHDGILENALPGEDDLNDKNQFALRGKLLFTPAENLNILLAGDYLQEDSRCCLPTFLTAGPPAGAIFFAQNPGATQLAPELEALGIVPGPGNRMTAVLDENILQESEAGGISLEVDYDLTSNLNLTSITAYRAWNIDEFNEADNLSTSNINNRNGTISSTDQFSQEIRLSGSFGEKFSFVSGLYYFYQDLDALGQVDIELAIPFPPFFNVTTVADRTVKTNSFAVFGEATYDLTDRLSIILGGRLSVEDIDATYDRVSTPIIPTAPFASFFGPDVVGVQAVNDTDFSGRAIARYFWTDNLQTYFSYSQGYKAPGIDVAESVNVNAIETPGGLPVLAPEIPELFEGGLRGQFFNDTLDFNLVLFTQDVENLQAISTDELGAITNLSIDLVRSRGAEVDTTFRPSFVPGLTLTGTVTFNEVDIQEFAANPILEGSRFRDSPRYFYSLTGDYRHDLYKGYEGFFRTEWTWQSSKNSSLVAAPFSQIDSYGLLNFRLGMNDPSGRYGITLAVENALDEDFPFFVFGSTFGVLDGNQTSAQFIGDPRTYSVTLRAAF